MGYNIRGEEYQAIRTIENRKKIAHRSIPTTSCKMSDEDYRELTSCHHDDEQYTDHSRPKFRKHTARYKRRFTINPHQAFVTIRKKDGIYSIEVSGDIHPEDKTELLESAESLPIGLTLTLKEAFDKLDV